MDKRFKNITKLSMSVLTFNISAGIQKSEILDFIRNKLMGLNTFNIKSIDELKYFKELIEEEIEITNDSLEIARGGVLNARKCIKLKTVGSDAGVFTTLEVEKDGIITADIAYNNTVFCFGNKKKTLEVSGRNVKAFMDKDGEIIIEKFVL